MSGIERNKVKNFCEPSPNSLEAAVGFLVILVKLAPRIGLMHKVKLSLQPNSNENAPLHCDVIIFCVFPTNF